MTPRPTLGLPADAPYRLLTGVGGLGTGLFFRLTGDHTLGRNESRPGELLDVRDYCKLHIIAHYVALLLGAQPAGQPFHVLPAGRVGDDAAGEKLLEEMVAIGMDVRHVARDAERPTALSVCFQYPDGSGGNITASNAAASALTCAEIDAVAPALERQGGRAIALAAPEVPLEARLHLLRLAGRYGALRVAALASAEMDQARALGLLALVDLLALNEDEAAALAGQPYRADDPQPLLDACAAEAAAWQPSMRLIVTAGEQGAWGYAGGRWLHCAALRAPVVSTAGAGDALLGGVLAGLAAGLPLIAVDAAPHALALGVRLAAAAVSSPHTIASDAEVARWAFS